MVLSMFITLQDTDGSYESTLGTMHDVLPEAMFDSWRRRERNGTRPLSVRRSARRRFPDLTSTTFAPAGPAIDLTVARAPPRIIIPTPNSQHPTAKRLSPRTLDSLGVGIWDLGIGISERDAIGSNNWAVSGALTADGNAIVANDMHLHHPRAEHVVSRLDGMARCRESSGPASPDRRHASRRSARRHRQQHAHRVGFHQHVRRLGRPRSSSRSIRPVRIAIARLTAGATFEHFDETIDVTGEPRAARGGDVDNLGSSSRARSSRTAARICLGGALGRPSRDGHHAARISPHDRGSV